MTAQIVFEPGLSLNTFREILNYSTEAILVVNGAGNISYANPVALAVTGYQFEQIKGQRALSYISIPQDSHHFSRIRDTLLQKNSWEGPATVCKNGGVGGSFKIRVRVYHEEGEDIPGYIVFLEDQDTREDQVSRIKQMQNLVSIGHMAGGIAHHFNNILAKLILQSEFFLLRENPTGSVRETVEKLLNIARSGSDSVRQFQEFRHQSQSYKALTNINEVVHKTVELMQTLSPSSVYVTGEITHQDVEVEANEEDICTALVNLITNGWESYPDHCGRVTVKLEIQNKPVDRSNKLYATSFTRSACIKVLDSGQGVKQSDGQTIFEPFFTYKDTSRHLGMGLTMVNDILERHNFWLDFDSNDGEGSEFRIWMPLSENETLLQKKQRLRKQLGNEKILLVDDEPFITDVGESLLSELGYNIQKCNHPSVALDIVDKEKDPFDLIVTDLTMPALSGYELSSELRKRGWKGKVILATGVVSKIDEGLVQESGITRVILKPCSILDLAQCIRQVLDAD